MGDGFGIGDLAATDVDDLAVGFASWPKRRSLFVRYADEAAAGTRVVLVARRGATVLGYVTVLWLSRYGPFAAAEVPEISDFNVLAEHRRAGVGTALMDEAEARVRAAGHHVVGLGVGLYADYGSAQRMYVKRGYVPDGAGVIIDAAAPDPGSMVRLDDDIILMFTKRLA